MTFDLILDECIHHLNFAVIPLHQLIVSQWPAPPELLRLPRLTAQDRGSPPGVYPMLLSLILGLDVGAVRLDPEVAQPVMNSLAILALGKPVVIQRRHRLD